MITETKESHIRVSNSNPDLYLDLGPIAGMRLYDALKRDSTGKTNLTFVAEVMLLPNGSRFPEYGFNCFKESDESLGYLLDRRYMSCWGACRLRKLTQEETDQMNTFKSSPEGKRFLFLHL